MSALGGELLARWDGNDVDLSRNLADLWHPVGQLVLSGGPGEVPEEEARERGGGEGGREGGRGEGGREERGKGEGECKGREQGRAVHVHVHVHVGLRGSLDAFRYK